MSARACGLELGTACARELAVGHDRQRLAEPAVARRARLTGEELAPADQPDVGLDGGPEQVLHLRSPNTVRRVRGITQTGADLELGGRIRRADHGGGRDASLSLKTAETIAQRIEILRGFDLEAQLYDEQHSGHGYSTEAVQLLVDYLSATKKQHRIHLAIVPDNVASVRIAEKCGFVLEGTMRGALFNDGRSQDLLIYSLLRTDPRPWHSRAEAPAAASERGDGQPTRQTS